MTVVALIPKNPQIPKLYTPRVIFAKNGNTIGELGNLGNLGRDGLETR